MRVLRAVLCMAVVMGLAAAVGAQGVQTGNIVGTVTDNNEEALPGVIVMVSGPNLQGTKATVTDTNGAFRFPSLPPGSEYKLTPPARGF